MSEPSTLRTRLGRLFTGDSGAFWALVVVVVYAYTQVPYFASASTVTFLLLDVIPILLIAMPMALVIITAEIDLSVASTAGLASAVLGVLWASGWSLWAAIAACLLLGVVAGAFNGFLVTTIGLPSLAVTIGTLALYRGLALVVIGDNAVASFPQAATSFVTSTIGGTGIPVFMVLVLVVVLAFGLLLHVTPFGRGVQALGYSKEAAAFVGIHVGRAKFWLFVATGLVSALAGIYWTLRYSSARSDNAEGLELAVVAAVLLGGVSIFGGRGTVPGVVSGVLLIGTVSYALRLDRVSDVVLSIVTGVLLVISVIAPQVTVAVRRFLDRRGHRSARPPGAARRRPDAPVADPSPPAPHESAPAVPTTRSER